MKRKIFFLLIISTVALALSFIEIKTIENKFNDKDYYEAVVLVKDGEIGDEINNNYVEYIKISGKKNPEHIIKEEFEKMDEYFFAKDINKGEILLNSYLCKKEDLSFSENNKILVTFEMAIPESNGWNLREDQNVDIIFCPNKGEEMGFKYKIYKNIKVKSYYDSELLKLNKSNKGRGKYITIEIGEKDGYELICNRQYGRIEIVVI